MRNNFTLFPRTFEEEVTIEEEITSIIWRIRATTASVLLFGGVSFGYP